jgi:hypothetical protein
MGYIRWLSETEYLHGELIRYLGEHPELNAQIEKTLIDITKTSTGASG